METYTFKRSAIYEETYIVQAESEEQAHELVYDSDHALHKGLNFASWYDDEFVLIDNEEQRQ